MWLFSKALAAEAIRKHHLNLLEILHYPSEPVLDAKAELGEGPFWNSTEQRLYWVNILAGEIYSFDPKTTHQQLFTLNQWIGAGAPAQGGLVLAVRDGFALLDTSAKRMKVIAEVEVDNHNNRMNDGKCDPSGRFWAGTMAVDSTLNAGALYRLGANFEVTRVLEDVTISNGLGWSPDARLMYYIDSPKGTVDVFDYDDPSGAISGRRPLFEFPSDAGIPDGMTVDSEGCLWSPSGAGRGSIGYLQTGH